MFFCSRLIAIALVDWVRLRAGHAPPHWREGHGGTWDAGYEATGYFLDWLEERYGYGTVRELNEALGQRAYDDEVFKALTGRKISKLWKLYKEHLAGGTPSQGGPALPTEGVQGLLIR